MTAIFCGLFSFLFVCSFTATITSISRTSLITTAAILPDQVFWNNIDLPSDLTSKNENEINKNEEDDNEGLEDSPLEDPYVIEGQYNLDDIGNDPGAIGLTAIFQNNMEVEVKTRDGSWI